MRWNEKHITSGVLQGSVLEPVLCTFSITDNMGVVVIRKKLNSWFSQNKVQRFSLSFCLMIRNRFPNLK